MANCFVRSYNVRIVVWFEKWKQVIKDQKEKERIITGLLRRQKIYAAAFLFNTLMQNAEKGKIALGVENSREVSNDMAKIQDEMNF